MLASWLIMATTPVVADCPPPPVSSAAQAECIARHRFEGTVTARPLTADARRRDTTWHVSVFDPSPDHLGGPGGEVVIDVETGKVLSTELDQ